MILLIALLALAAVAGAARASRPEGLISRHAYNNRYSDAAGAREDYLG